MKTAEERLAELQERRKKEEERLRKLKEQERDLLKQQKAAERKERTRRLIICGGAIEAALGRPVDLDAGEDKQIAEIITSYSKSEAVLTNNYEAVVSDILGRKLTENDIRKFRKFLEFQNKRGNYFSQWMNRE